MDGTTALSLAAAGVLAVLQLAPSLLDAGDTRGGWPRRLTSLGGGFSVAFVFLYLLPELEEAGDAVAGAAADALAFAAHEAHLLALTGLVTLYGLEHIARRARNTTTRVMTVETAAFACYYAVVGLVLWQRAADGVADLVTFAVAVGVHFLVIDWRLARRHRRQYQRRARPVLSAMVLVGWATGAIADVPVEVTGGLTAFLAGGIVLVALKEELPVETHDRFTWFAAGAVAYALLLTLLPA